MGVFDDKKFEELDWISQATEPIDSELNNVLATIPDEIIVDFNTYKKMVNDNSYTLDIRIDTILDWAISTYVGKYISWDQKNILKPCFELTMNGDDVYLDFEKQVITGEIKLTKIVSTMDEKVLEGILGKEGIDALNHLHFSGPALTRANEIMELLTKCEDGLKTRSDRKKIKAIKNRLIALFKANEWKIKDTELANKVGYWIRDYIRDGNLAAFSNFCRLKVMTHKEQPIYSMEEVQ